MALSFLTVARFRLLTTIPVAYVNACDVAEPDWIKTQLETQTAWLVARLSKRYGPFETPYPAVIEGWLVDLVNARIWLKRGHDPTDEQSQAYTQKEKDAKAEVLEAANSEEGLFELPLKATTPSENGITRGGTFGYSEQSPFVAFDQQAETGRDEDRSGGGTYG